MQPSPKSRNLFFGVRSPIPSPNLPRPCFRAVRSHSRPGTPPRPTSRRRQQALGRVGVCRRRGPGRRGAFRPPQMPPRSEQPARATHATGPGANPCRPQGAVRWRPRELRTPLGPQPRPQLRTRTGRSQKAVMDNSVLKVPRNTKAQTGPSSFQAEKETAPLHFPNQGAPGLPFPLSTENSSHLFHETEKNVLFFP